MIGAGGVFKQVLVDSGVGPALGEALTGMGLPIAITCFVLAARSAHHSGFCHRSLFNGGRTGDAGY
ncbi:hypothetical protein ACLB1M_27005 [Escherichia coli]